MSTVSTKEYFNEKHSISIKCQHSMLNSSQLRSKWKLLFERGKAKLEMSYEWIGMTSVTPKLKPGTKDFSFLSLSVPQLLIAQESITIITYIFNSDHRPQCTVFNNVKFNSAVMLGLSSECSGVIMLSGYRWSGPGWSRGRDHPGDNVVLVLILASSSQVRCDGASGAGHRSTMGA